MNIPQAFLIRSFGRRNRVALLLLTALALAACQAKKSEPVADAPVASQASVAQTSEPAPTQASAPALKPQDAFWAALSTLCDKSFEGQLTIGTEESDREIGLARLTMHSKRCKRDAIDIGFSVDEDDSRTWMFRRTDDGLSLHHRHVDKSGKPDATSGYGGYTSAQGNAVRQEFQADENTGTMIPAAATNVWAVEVKPGETFAYELQRIEQQRMFRVVFDLTAPLAR